MSDLSNQRPRYLERGTREYFKTSLALFAAGFATFSSMYAIQPLMPLFSREFGVSAAVSSLSLSVTTGVLAFTLFAAGLMSDAIDRKTVMTVSLLASAVLSVLAAVAPGWTPLLVARAVEGFALGGVPALAMAYLSEEIEPAALGSATGLYIAGNAMGGMGGRVIAGLLADLFGWRIAIATIGAIGFVAAVIFFWLLPRSRNFTARKGLSFRDHAKPVASHLQHAALPAVFFCGFAFMGAFVSIYNYAAFRLAAAPFSLGQAAIGGVFTIYILGIFTSAFAGRIADRHGRPPVLAFAVILMAIGLAITSVDALAAIVVGIALITIGFFAGHSTASGWVGLLAEHGKGHAAGLYLLSYYLGSSVIGSVGGLFWASYGWPGVTAMVAFLLLAAFAATLWLMRWHGRVAQSS